MMKAPASTIADHSSEFSSGVSLAQRCSSSAGESPNGRSSVWWSPAMNPSAEMATLV
jgi:hypothetical protein